MLMFSLLAVAEPTRVIVLDVRADGASETTARVIRDEITQALGSDPRLEALSSEDLRRVVSLEAERRVLGCVDESCIAEVGQALGARYAVHGSISVVGAVRIVRVNVLDTEDNRSVTRETIEARSDEELLPLLRSAGARIKDRLLETTGAVPASKLSPTQIGGIAIGGIGVASAVGGGVLMGLAWPTFINPDKDLEERQQARGMGQWGTVLLAGGAVAAIGGTALAIIGGDP